MAASTLIEKIVCATSSGSGLNKPSARQRDLAISRVIDHLNGARSSPLNMAKLCEIARVSERTLQYAFNARYGMSPYRFAIQWRLNSVRRELRCASRAGHSIAEVAQRYGFDNPSLFAQRYRELFSELPSETLVRPDGR
jgi:AraC family ethanolamine operon transcriptional activator